MDQILGALAAKIYYKDRDNFVNKVDNERIYPA